MSDSKNNRFDLNEMRVRFTFFEDVLGSSNPDFEIYDKYIASKAPDAASRAEETTNLIQTEGLDKAIEQRKTVFPKLEDGTPFVYDYQIKGYFKDVCGMLRRVPGTLSSKIRAYKKEIDGLIFVKERTVPFNLSGDIGECQRPLRTSTPQGECNALANSEAIPAGSTIEFTIQTFTPEEMKWVEEWLDYGEYRGFGQWRNSGKGKFTWVNLSEK